MKYGDPKDYFKYIAMAPYFGPADDTTTASLDGIFTACTANINSMASVFTDFANLAQQYGLQMAAYEGGQGMGGSTNLSFKHLAQFDKRMYDTYTSYYAFWQQHFGKSLFMHFVLAETPGTPDFNFQFGFWGALEGVMSDLATCGKNVPTFTGSEQYQTAQKYCPKYQASVDAALK